MTKNGEILFDSGIPGEFLSAKAKIKDQRLKKKEKNLPLCYSVSLWQNKREIPSSLRSSE
jgi:hypothetical protein